MFNSKQKQLFATGNEKATSVTNSFVKAGLKETAKTTSLGNGAVKYTTTNNDFVDDFGKITNYKAPRSYQEIDTTMRLLSSQDLGKTLSLLFYIRMITRNVMLFDGTKTETVQRGQGLKHEGIFRMMWMQLNHNEVFWNNIGLFISVGSWKDIITMLSYDLQYNGWNDRKLDWNNFGKLLLAGLENPNTSELIKKYLPQIKSNKSCTTLESQADNMIAKWICSLIFGGKTEDNDYRNYRSYRKLKSAGTAHQWQQLISQGKLKEIDFNTVHGRALAQLVSGKFLANNGLEEVYDKWIESKPIAKYTGYVYELLAPIIGIGTRCNISNVKPYQINTINAQFMGLVELAKKDMSETDSGMLVVLDTSGSMTSTVPGTKISSFTVGKSMALYFSYLLKGAFQDVWMEFSNKAEMRKWKGKTPVERLVNETSSIIAGTNFQSVGDEFIKLLHQGVPQSDFPKGIICISDGCFNHSGRNKTETKNLKQNLLNAGFSKEYVDNFKIVLWDMPNGFYGKSQTAFEDFADTPNLYHMSGLDGSAIAFLTGTKQQISIPKNSEELFEAAMNQQILNMLQV